MSDVVIHKTIIDKQNSIEVSKNAKGDIQYAIKIYFNIEDIDKTMEQLNIIQHKVTGDIMNLQIINKERLTNKDILEVIDTYEKKE